MLTYVTEGGSEYGCVHCLSSLGKLSKIRRIEDADGSQVGLILSEKIWPNRPPRRSVPVERSRSRLISLCRSNRLLRNEEIRS